MTWRSSDCCLPTRCGRAGRAKCARLHRRGRRPLRDDVFARDPGRGSRRCRARRLQRARDCHRACTRPRAPARRSFGGGGCPRHARRCLLRRLRGCAGNLIGILDDFGNDDWTFGRFLLELLTIVASVVALDGFVPAARARCRARLLVALVDIGREEVMSIVAGVVLVARGPRSRPRRSRAVRLLAPPGRWSGVRRRRARARGR